MEKLVHRVEGPKCTLSHENGYFCENWVTEETLHEGSGLHPVFGPTVKKLLFKLSIIFYRLGRVNELLVISKVAQGTYYLPSPRRGGHTFSILLDFRSALGSPVRVMEGGEFYVLVTTT